MYLHYNGNHRFGSRVTATSAKESCDTIILLFCPIHPCPFALRRIDLEHSRSASESKTNKSKFKVCLVLKEAFSYPLTESPAFNK